MYIWGYFSIGFQWDGEGDKGKMLVVEGTYKIAMRIRSRRIDKDKRRIYIRKNDKIVKKYIEMQAKLSKKYETFEGKYDKNASLII